MAAEGDNPDAANVSNMIYLDNGQDNGIRENEDFHATEEDQKNTDEDGISVIQLKKDGTKLTINTAKISGGSVSVRNGASLKIRARLR